MASLLYKNTGIDMTLGLVGEKIDRNRFTGEKVENSTFFNCDFSGADLSGTEFIGCRFNWSTQQLCENMGLRRFFE
ncbi:MAG: hypothetical protein ACFWT4_14370 [Citrobacter braakii]|jgi:fluoroquinolone resistance protein